METPAEPPTASRGRMVTARILVVLGAVLAVLSLLAGFIRFQALDTPTVRNTADELISDEVVRDQIAATLVDELFANVDVAAALQERLPPDQQGLAGPIAAGVMELADRARAALARATSRAAALGRHGGVLARTADQGARGRRVGRHHRERRRVPRPAAADRAARGPPRDRRASGAAAAERRRPDQGDRGRPARDRPGRDPVPQGARQLALGRARAPVGRWRLPSPADDGARFSARSRSDRFSRGSSFSSFGSSPATT